ncbi:MAG: hypothetical protein RIC14_02450 [Filomicrobium sp.]
MRFDVLAEASVVAQTYIDAIGWVDDIKACRDIADNVVEFRL